MIHVAVCTPLPALRAGLRALISGDPDLAVVAVSTSIEDLPDDAPAPEVIVATPEGAGGLVEGALAPVSGRAAPPGAILLVCDDPRMVRRLAENAAGLPAWGAISPEASGEALQAAIHALAEGLVIFSPEVFDPRLVAEKNAALLTSTANIADVEEGEEPVEALTPREHEILGFLSQGLTNKQIALALHISEHTVKFHVSSVYSKLGASNRTEAVRKGARRGWVAL